MFRILYKPGAGRDIDKLPRHVLPGLRDAIAALASNPRPHGCKKLRGPGELWRIRVGTYRVVYEIDDAAQVIRVARAGHRREIYR